MKKIILLVVLSILNISFFKNFYSYNIDKSNNNNREDYLYYTLAPTDIDFVSTNNYSFDLLNQNTSSPNTIQKDTFIPDIGFRNKYYSNLNKNFPFNNLGICGYTAISMFFSYYDTYWNDGFIADEYDSTPTKIRSTDFIYNFPHDSPGVFNDLSSSSPTLKNLHDRIKSSGLTDEESLNYKVALENQILNEIQLEIQKDTFLGNLFNIALNNGSIAPHNSNDVSGKLNSGYLDGIGVNNKIMNAMVKDYISQNGEINNKITIVTSEINTNMDIQAERTRIRNEIIGEIKKGKPVIIGGGHYDDLNKNGIQDDGESRSGHVAVAYDYDETNNVIYGHMGWNSNYNHYNFDNYFNIEFSDYWSINIGENCTKNFTNNYIFSDKDCYYCPNTDITMPTYFEPISLGTVKRGQIISQTSSCYYMFTAPLDGEYIITAKILETFNPLNNVSPYVYYTLTYGTNFIYAEDSSIYMSKGEIMYIKVSGYMYSFGTFSISINKDITIDVVQFTNSIDYFTTDAKFTWGIKKNSSDLIFYGLVFYDLNFNEIYRTVYDIYTTYTLKSKDICSILNLNNTAMTYYSVQALSFEKGFNTIAQSNPQKLNIRINYEELNLEFPTIGQIRNSGEARYYKFTSNRNATYNISALKIHDYLPFSISPVLYSSFTLDLDFYLDNEVEVYMPKNTTIYFKVVGYMNSIGDFEISVSRQNQNINPLKRKNFESIITPADYGYKEQYFFDEQISNVSINNLAFETKRLRTGYISKEYVVMSPRRADAGVAYLEYKFTDYIDRIDIDLALWSNSELLRPSDCTAVLQYRNNEGEWITILDLLNDITLTTNRAEPIAYHIVFPDNVKEFRLYSTAPAIGATNNTGRLCIGNINLYRY